MNETTLNRATLIGRVAREPEIRKTPAGRTTASFTLITVSEWRDKHGNRCSRSFGHRVMIFDDESAKFTARRIR